MKHCNKEGRTVSEIRRAVLRDGPRGTATAPSSHSRRTGKDVKDTLADTLRPLMNATRPRRLLRWLQRGLAAALLAYGALLAALICARQEALLLHPEPLPADFSFAGRYAPEQDFEEAVWWGERAAQRIL